MQLAAQEDSIVVWDDTCNLYRLFQWSLWHRSFYWEVGTRSFELPGWMGLHTCTLGSIRWKCWGYALLGWMMCTGEICHLLVCGDVTQFIGIVARDIQLLYRFCCR